MLPKDPVILLGYINAKLRDQYGSLMEFCDDTGNNMVEICTCLDQIDYHYSIERNQFV